VTDPASVLALIPPQVFVPRSLHGFGQPGPGNSIEDSATTSASGKTITLSFSGGHARNAPSAVGYFRKAVLHLDRPLGARVLVSATDSGAVPVAPARQPESAAQRHSADELRRSDNIVPRYRGTIVTSSIIRRACHASIKPGSDRRRTGP
jgi:hypothetical protein